ncbi:MAG: polysaccharide biosynthesis protein [Myxococcaceae bacterium]|nr:polysaccharide biosynthesis protein [Myxococcaceae bacterium]
MNQTLGQKLMLHYRRALVVLVHAALFSASILGAFLLRFEFSIPEEYFPISYAWLGAILVFKLLCFAWFGMFSGMWRYTGARDLVSLFRAATVATGLFALFIVLGGHRSFPRSILVIDWLLTMMLVGGLRFGIRSLWQLASAVTREADRAERRRILVVGAGDAGEMLLREMQRMYAHRYQPVAVVDDDRRKIGQHIHGVPVVGTVDQAQAVVSSRQVNEIVIAIPTANGKQMRRILDACKPAGVAIRTIPGIDQVVDGHVTMNQLRSVDIEDLLGREPVTLDTRSLVALLEGRVVMVTGAGGSIGSELCRQVARFKPSQLLLVEQAENALFEIHRELSAKFPLLHTVPCVADICDVRRMERLFVTHQPSAVFHAAAHKHVPMMEANPGEALKNNVGGTRVVADLAHRFNVDSFVMISTDKAVNPTSLMGATKRVAEIYVQAMSQRSKTRFVAVRFGNVLGSAGSVLPIFKEQIAAGGPITVTHPDMRRYFMTIPEASQLVLQAGTMGRGGEIFVLDMGEPVKIVDLARDLITLSGLKPGEDIEIKFSGVRPGEKLFEELNAADENADKTLHPKIFIGRLAPRPYDAVVQVIDGLVGEADSLAMPALLERVKQLVPELQRAQNDGARPAADVIPLKPARAVRN